MNKIKNIHFFIIFYCPTNLKKVSILQGIKSKKDVKWGKHQVF